MIDIERLRDLRKSRGITQEKIAQALGVQRTTYNRYETGGIQPPSDIILKLAEYFNTTSSYILGEVDDPAPPKQKQDELGFGDRLKKIIEKKNITEKKLSELAGIPTEIISKIISENKVPDSDLLHRISIALETSPKYLLGKTNDPRNYILEPDFDSFIIQRDPGGPFEKFDELPEEYQKQIINIYNLYVEKHFREIGESK